MTTTVGWKEPFLTFKCWFLLKCLVPSQQKMAVCHCLPTGVPKVGTDWNKDPVIFLQGRETSDLVYNWLKNQKFMYFLFPLQSVLSTLPLKGMGCFWECSSQNLPCSLQSMCGVLCPPSIKLKPKSFIRCTPCITHFPAHKLEWKLILFEKHNDLTSLYHNWLYHLF